MIFKHSSYITILVKHWNPLKAPVLVGGGGGQDFNNLESTLPEGACIIFLIMLHSGS